MMAAVFTRFTVLFALVLACSTSTPQPGQSEFEAASSKIATSSAGARASGNTEAARSRAEKVAALMTALDRELFAGHDKDRVFTRTDEFMVHCQHGAEGVAFLIHVPQFKRYRDEVRETLVNAAWAAARTATRDLEEGAPLKLGVGLRGGLLFGATAVGVTGSEPTITLGTTVAVEPLYPYFIGPPPPQAEAAPALEDAVEATPPKEAPPEPPPPPPEPPKLQVRTLFMELLATSIVDTEIRAHDDDLQACAAGLNAGDRYTYNIKLGGDGKVKKLVGAADRDPPPEALTTCLNKAAKQWRFPKKQLKLTKPEGGRIEFDYSSPSLD